MLISCNKIPNKKKSAIRKPASSFSFALYDNVPSINEAHWNKVIGNKDGFLQLLYLRALENAPPSNMRFYYALIYDEQNPVAAAYFQMLNFNAENLEGLLTEDENGNCFSGFKKYLTNHILKSVDKVNMRLLICGNSFISGEHGFIHTPEITPDAAFDALADVIYRISNSEKLRGKVSAVLIKDFYKSTVKNAKELEEFRYHDFLVEPNMILKIKANWNTFEDYANALSKKYRNRAKKILSKGSVFERRLLSIEEIEKHSKKIHELYTNVLFKAKFRLAILPVNYFIEMHNKLKDNFQLTGYFFNEELVGFKSSFLLKYELEAHFVGMDYSINKEFELYQNILYDYVKEAILYKKNILHLGRTASEIKSNLGAKAYELTCYARHRNPLSNRIIRPLIDYLKPEEWTPRNPFKEEGVLPMPTRL